MLKLYTLAHSNHQHIETLSEKLLGQALPFDEHIKYIRKIEKRYVNRVTLRLMDLELHHNPKGYNVYLDALS